jgi:hypothetical protein
MRILVALTTRWLVLLVIGGPSLARADSTWVDHYRAARAAHAAGDLHGFRDQLRIVQGVVGDQPGVNYNLACAAARLGERDEALRRLELYAASGMVRDLAADSDFVALWGDADFQRVAARVRANGDSIGTARVRHRFRDADLLTEDLAYDPVSYSYFASSVRQGSVIEVAADGTERTWSDSLARPGFGVYAVCVDSRHRRLWASVGASPITPGYVASDSGRTGLVAWDLTTRRPVRRIEWPADGHDRLLGDLTVGSDGTVYVSDSPAGAVRMLAPGAERMTTLVPDDSLEGPQTPALSSDGRRLYVADYARGVGVIDLSSGRRTWMTFAPGIAIQGIDGLYAYGNDLIAVQNGTHPSRVMRFRLDRSGTRIESGTPIESGTRRLGEPTHGVVVGRRFAFLANTGWDRVGKDQSIQPGAPPMILEAELAR